MIVVPVGSGRWSTDLKQCHARNGHDDPEEEEPNLEWGREAVKLPIDPCNAPDAEGRKEGVVGRNYKGVSEFHHCLVHKVHRDHRSQDHEEESHVGRGCEPLRLETLLYASGQKCRECLGTNDCQRRDACACEEVEDDRALTPLFRHQEGCWDEESKSPDISRKLLCPHPVAPYRVRHDRDECDRGVVDDEDDASDNARDSNTLQRPEGLPERVASDHHVGKHADCTHRCHNRSGSISVGDNVGHLASDDSKDAPPPPRDLGKVLDWIPELVRVDVVCMLHAIHPHACGRRDVSGVKKCANFDDCKTVVVVMVAVVVVGGSCGGGGGNGGGVDGGVRHAAACTLGKVPSLDDDIPQERQDDSDPDC